MFKQVMAQARFINEEAARASWEHVSFSFGENWKKYLSDLEEPTIGHAVNSFVDFTQLSSLEGHTFLDIGSGSGLSSLVAYRLGAKRIVSVDIDPNSIDCITALRNRFASGTNLWAIRQGSALDRSFLHSLGVFSYVYSWGVLHHTGSMWQALENVANSVDFAGKLHIALYNHHRNSEKWLKIKRACNRWPRTVLPVAKVTLALSMHALLLARFQSPTKYMRQYATPEKRGMSFWRDIEDWLCGLPYEYCKPDQVVDFLSKRGFVALGIKTAASHGNNEFLFRSDIGPKRTG
jgi:SAM-dependent methyltransferase